MDLYITSFLFRNIATCFVPRSWNLTENILHLVRVILCLRRSANLSFLPGQLLTGFPGGSRTSAAGADGTGLEEALARFNASAREVKQEHDAMWVRTSLSAGNLSPAGAPRPLEGPCFDPGWRRQLTPALVAGSWTSGGSDLPAGCLAGPRITKSRHEELAIWKQRTPEKKYLRLCAPLSRWSNCWSSSQSLAFSSP